jgi:hypothetical protein
MTRKKITLICAISGSIATITGAATGITLANQGKIHTHTEDTDKTSNFEK